MSLKTTISDILNTPVQYIFPKVRTQFQLRSKKSEYAKSDNIKSTFLSKIPKNWKSFCFSDKIELSESETEVLKGYSNKYASHQFNILGSTWINWSYDHAAKGFLSVRVQDQNRPDVKKKDWLGKVVNASNLLESERIWNEIKIINSDYQPIDWSRDMKSGHNFGYRMHFSQITTLTGIKGVDIKVPWEMGRLHYLPGFALYAIKTNDSGLIGEVKCQVLDFIMSNPPRWGVQWTSAMDASMRLFNLCVIYDLLSQKENQPEESFYKILRRSIQEHIYFCWEFREHKDGLGNNHYLANLLGVIAGTGCLIENGNESILESASHEFLKEMDKQFLEDGGNFESSLPYHFFASEIGVLGLSLLSQNTEYSNLDSFKSALYKMEKAYDLCHSCNHNGIIPQIGDNDSARMFYWYIEADKKGAFPDLLNYNSSLSLLNGFFNTTSSDNAHSLFIRSISGLDSIDLFNSDFEPNSYHIDELNFSKETIYENMKNTDLQEELIFKCFLDSGIYVFKGKNLFLTVCGTNRHVKQYWPHTHNDKLSIELWMNDEAVVRDPGSYVYTADSKVRNTYRSAGAHAGIVFDREMQNSWEEGSKGVFRTKEKTHVVYLGSENNRLALKAKYSDVIHIREIIVEPKRVRIIDYCNRDFEVNQFPDIAFSNGYGSLEK